jgi:hypothetical protein
MTTTTIEPVGKATEIAKHAKRGVAAIMSAAAVLPATHASAVLDACNGMCSIPPKDDARIVSFAIKLAGRHPTLAAISDARGKLTLHWWQSRCLRL